MPDPVTKEEVERVAEADSERWECDSCGCEFVRANQLHCRISELEREIQALDGELAIAYGVIDEIPEDALSRVSDSKLLAAVRVMEKEEKRDMASSGLQSRVERAERENASFRSRLAELERFVLSCANDGCGCAIVVKDGEGSRPFWCPEQKPDEPNDWCWCCKARAALAAAKEDTQTERKFKEDKQ